ncbi:MAG: hypothetical protein IJ139_05760 [Bacteroidaceae bacterium]|nr:hypothetical protein [Bacteroidaceae bacterium]
MLDEENASSCSFLIYVRFCEDILNTPRGYPQHAARISSTRREDILIFLPACVHVWQESNENVACTTDNFHFSTFNLLFFRIFARAKQQTDVFWQ